MPFKLGPLELVIILVIVLVIFGAGKLPEIGSSLGKAIRGFRQSASVEGEEAKPPAPSAKDQDKRG